MPDARRCRCSRRKARSRRWRQSGQRANYRACGRDAVFAAGQSRDYVKTGDLLAEMADLHHVRVRAFIDEPELGALERTSR